MREQAGQCFFLVEMHCTSAQLLVLPYLVKAVKRYRGTSFIRKHTALEPFCKPMPRIWGWS